MERKVVSSLPGTLIANTLYFVRVGTGFRPYITNSSGTIVAYGLDPITWSELGGIPANITAIAALASAANKLPYFTGSGAAALADLTSSARVLLDDATPAAQREPLGTPYLRAITLFSSSGTWTKPAGLAHVVVEACASGGGSAGTTGNGGGGGGTSFGSHMTAIRWRWGEHIRVRRSRRRLHRR